MLYMYIWDSDFLTDYTSGIACAVAYNVEQAREMILEEVKKNGVYGVDSAANDLKGEPDRILPLPCAAFCGGGA